MVKREELAVCNAYVEAIVAQGAVKEAAEVVLMNAQLSEMRRLAAAQSLQSQTSICCHSVRSHQLVSSTDAVSHAAFCCR